MITFYILLSAVAVMLISLVGIITTAKTFGGWAERNLKYLTSFATGVFIIVAYNLLREIFHSELEVGIILGIIAFGVIIGYLVDKVIPHSHHHHDDQEQPGAHTKSGAHRIILSDVLHNITDGFLLVPAFIIDVRLGFLVAGGILIHEIAQEISEFFVLRSAGYSTKTALLINFISSSSILLGVVIALALTQVNEEIITTLLAVAAGIIVFTIFNDLIPYSFKSAQKEQTYGKHFISILAGAVLIGIITFTTAGTHTHDQHNHDHESHHDDHSSHHENAKDKDHDASQSTLTDPALSSNLQTHTENHQLDHIDHHDH